MDFKHSLPVQIRFSDVDQFGHMNNSVYFSLYDLAKTTYLRDVMGGKELDWKDVAMVVANVNANFFAPVFFSDQLVIQTTTVHLGHKSFTLLQRAVNVAKQEVKCECRTVMVGYNMRNLQAELIPEEWKQAICAFEGKSETELSAREVK
mgnify:CR=1 FL=1